MKSVLKTNKYLVYYSIYKYINLTNSFKFFFNFFFDFKNKITINLYVLQISKILSIWNYSWNFKKVNNFFSNYLINNKKFFYTTNSTLIKHNYYCNYYFLKFKNNNYNLIFFPINNLNLTFFIHFKTLFLINFWMFSFFFSTLNNFKIFSLFDYKIKFVNELKKINLLRKTKTVNLLNFNLKLI